MVQGLTPALSLLPSITRPVEMVLNVLTENLVEAASLSSSIQRQSPREEIYICPVPPKVWQPNIKLLSYISGGTRILLRISPPQSPPYKMLNPHLLRVARSSVLLVATVLSCGEVDPLELGTRTLSLLRSKQLYMVTLVFAISKP